MGFKIRLPSILHGGFEGQHQHAASSHLLRQLVGGEGLAEPHLRVPEEAWDGGGVLLPAGLIIGIGLLDSACLLVARRKILVMGAGELLAGTKLRQHGFQVRDRTLHPFKLWVEKALSLQGFAHGMIGNDAAVIPLGALVQLNDVVGDSGGLELLRHPLLHVAGGLPDFQQTLMRIRRNAIGIDARARFGFRRENILDGWLIHHCPPSGGSCFRCRQPRPP